MIYTYLTILAWIMFPLGTFVVGFSIYEDLRYEGSILQTLDRIQRIKRDHMAGCRFWFWSALFSLVWLFTYYIKFGGFEKILKYGGYGLLGLVVLGLVVWFSKWTYDYYRSMK